MGMNMNPEDATAYGVHYQKAILQYVENEYGAKHRHVPVDTLDNVLSNNLIHCRIPAGFDQS
jgi:hypothetical protein